MAREEQSSQHEQCQTPAAITIRPAYADDQTALARLAVLDSAAGVPAAPLLLAEVDGELRAALSLADGSVIADPFFPTLHLVTLLRTHAAAVTDTRARSTRRRCGGCARASRPAERRCRLSVTGPSTTPLLPKLRDGYSDFTDARRGVIRDG